MPKFALLSLLVSTMPGIRACGDDLVVVLFEFLDDDTKLAQSCTEWLYVQHWYTVVPHPAMRVTLWALMTSKSSSMRLDGYLCEVFHTTFLSSPFCGRFSVEGVTSFALLPTGAALGVTCLCVFHMVLLWFVLSNRTCLLYSAPSLDQQRLPPWFWHPSSGHDGGLCDVVQHIISLFFFSVVRVVSCHVPAVHSCVLFR